MSSVRNAKVIYWDEKNHATPIVLLVTFVKYIQLNFNQDNMSLPSSKIEVMKYIGQNMDGIIEKFLMPIEKIWQPADFLPDSTSENFISEVKLLQEECKELPYDYIAVLIGDTITEEALPTYEAWLMDMDGVDNVGNPSGWAKWVRAWSSEENRHGDLLNKYLYLSGRVNMRQMEVSTQYLIADGYDIGTDRDPYKNFIYTSFQELATNISHKRTATLSKKHGNKTLAKMCAMVAADEMRHYKAYKSFINSVFDIDASGAMIAFEENDA